MSKTGSSKLALSRASNPPYVEADGDPQKDSRPHINALHSGGRWVAKQDSTQTITNTITV